MAESNGRSATIRRWFAAGELEECRVCGTLSVVTTEEGHRYCFECGHLPESDETVARGDEGAEA